MYYWLINLKFSGLGNMMVPYFLTDASGSFLKPSIGLAIQYSIFNPHQQDRILMGRLPDFSSSGLRKISKRL